MRRIALLLLLPLAACGETTPADEFGNGNGAGANAADMAGAANALGTVPVRVGEMGTSFAACSAAGTTRNLGPGETLPVREAPFDAAGEIGSVPAGAQFFICTRSHDQKWLGTVYEEDGTLTGRCGVSAPTTRRRAYDGPCKSGWVPSAFVKLISGVDTASPPIRGDEEGGNVAEPSPPGA